MGTLESVGQPEQTKKKFGTQRRTDEEIGVDERQFRLLRDAYRKKRDQVVAHGPRSRFSNRRCDE